MERVGVFHG
uniref:Uncharacterized protein n=1 Tax=Arundo donax TaxID=35708 RepID=A0A0A9HEW6_ARUDO